MEAAVNNGVPGIDADCGGQCSCATCHVILSDSDFSKFGDLGDMESSMIDMNPEKTGTSRLSCQIKLEDSMDGLVVNLPEFQG